MKTMIGILLSLFFIAPTWADAPGDFSYIARFSPEGGFTLSLSFSLPNSSFADFVSNLHNEKVLKKTERLTLAHQATETQKGEFLLRTKMSKLHVNAEFDSLCTYSRGIGTYSERCTLLVDKSDGARFFRNATTSLSCRAGETQTVCQRSMVGEVREINFLILNRSGRQLAVSGAVESIESTFSYQLYFTQPSTTPTVTSTYRQIIAPFWKRASMMMQKLSDRQLLEVSGDPINGIRFQAVE